MLLGVRVPQKLHQRIESECALRDMNLKELVVAALEYYFTTPTEWDYAATTFVRHPAGASDREVTQRDAWMATWVKFIDQMPEEQAEVYVRAMSWDLRTLKASRRKPSARKRQSQGERG